MEGKKFVTFVRCMCKLLTTCSNKHKNFLGSNSKLLADSIHQLITGVEEETTNGFTSGNKSAEVNAKLCTSELLRLLNGNPKSCLPQVAKSCLTEWFRSLRYQDPSQVAVLRAVLECSAKFVSRPEDAADVVDVAIDSAFAGDDTTASWREVTARLAFPRQDKIPVYLEHCVASGLCLPIYAYICHKLSTCQSIKDEEVLLVSLLDWLRHFQLSHECEPKLTSLYHTCILLCQRQATLSTAGPKVIKHVVDFIDVLFAVARIDTDGSWNILGMITSGLSATYRPTPRAKFLALSLAYFLLKQVAAGPTLRTDISSNTGSYQFPERVEKCEQMLTQMTKDQAYLGLSDAIDWVKTKASDDTNTFHDTPKFLEYLASNNLYTERHVTDLFTS